MFLYCMDWLLKIKAKVTYLNYNHQEICFYISFYTIYNSINTISFFHITGARGFLVRRRMCSLKRKRQEAAIRMQSAMRGHMQRQMFKRQRESVVVLQSGK